MSNSMLERLRFYKFEDAHRQNVSKVLPIIDEHIGEILTGFYDHISSWPHLSEKIGNAGNVERLKNAQTHHWKLLFSGKFDQEYINQAERIGRAHERIGLEPRWYMGAYAYTQNKLIAKIIEKYRRKPKEMIQLIEAVNIAISMDVEFVVSLYFDIARETEHKKLQELGDKFDQQVSSVVKQVADAANAMTLTSEEMSANADQTQSQTTTVASAAEQASVSVQTAASAAEELAASIAEISSQVGQSAAVANTASTHAKQTNETVRGLAEKAEKIGEVIKLINDIASQTNLLALNATIEAARAGEAGKGFAVVANEVKSLANQTAQATDQIASQINSIQTVTKDTVTAIDLITNTIDEMDNISSAISAAVEEQSASTQEIARAVEQAALGTKDVSETIVQVKEAASQTGTAARSVLESSSSLYSQSEDLAKEVHEFLSGIRKTA